MAQPHFDEEVWSTIESNDYSSYLIKLEGMVLSKSCLLQNGYQSQQLTPEQLDLKMKCKNCHHSKSQNLLHLLRARKED